MPIFKPIEESEAKGKVKENQKTHLGMSASMLDKFFRIKI